MSIFGPFRPIQRGDRMIDGSQLNELFEIAHRIGNFTATPPLVLAKGATGFHLALNKTPDAAMVVVNSGPNSDGYYDASLLSWNPVAKAWNAVENVWLLNGNSGTLAAGSRVDAVDMLAPTNSAGETFFRRVFGTGIASAGGVLQLFVVAVYADYLGCVAFTPPSSGGQPYSPSNGQAEEPVFYVAKPYELQQTPWDGKSATLNGQLVTFHYTGVGTRTVSQSGVGSENQVVVPDYVTGDLVLATTAPCGLTDANGDPITLIDVNSAARAWALASN